MGFGKDKVSWILTWILLTALLIIVVWTMLADILISIFTYFDNNTMAAWSGPIGAFAAISIAIGIELNQKYKKQQDNKKIIIAYVKELEIIHLRIHNMYQIFVNNIDVQTGMLYDIYKPKRIAHDYLSQNLKEIEINFIEKYIQGERVVSLYIENFIEEQKRFHHKRENRQNMMRACNDLHSFIKRYIEYINGEVSELPWGSFRGTNVGPQRVVHSPQTPHSA